MPAYHPDGDALRASGVSIVPAVGAASGAAMPRRAGEALAALLGVDAVEFPGDHGGFAANEWSPHNNPAAFAAKLHSCSTATSSNTVQLGREDLVGRRVFGLWPVRVV